MKKVLVYIFALMFLFSVCGNVWAVDKKDKTAPPVSIKKEDKKKQQEQKKTEQPAKEDKPAPPKQKKYDDFVDKNNNGIDDRKENLKEKPSQDTQKDKKTTKP